MATATKKTTKRAAAKKPTVEAEFRAFKKEQQETNETILSVLEKMDTKLSNSAAAASVTTEAPSAGVASIPHDVPLQVTDEEAAEAQSAEAMAFMPPNYKRVFEKYFDPEDGFTARLAFPETRENGSEDGGITFTIFVPEKFSNVTEAHKSLYKIDLRTRALQPHNIAKGIEDWCARVAKNLKYNKNIKTK